MKVIVNGKEKTLKAGATLKEAVAGEVYVKDTLVSVHLSTEKLVKETDDFELVTSAGPMVLHLDDSDDARLWKSKISEIVGVTSRWVTQEVVAFGSFRTDIPVDRTERRYKPYDCFFSLGGFDNHTTFIMMARKDHFRSYGAGTGRIGRITVGRHLLNVLKEGEGISDIRPVRSETRSDNVVVTKDLTYKLEEGYRVETNIHVVLDDRCPESAEQVLIVGSKGYVNITDSTGSYAGSKDDMDISMSDEKHEVRDIGSVTVRNAGTGLGHLMFYRQTRQVSPAHNSAGKLDRGLVLVSRAGEGDKITMTTEPMRALAVGMTQAQGAEFLAGFGIEQKRSGDVSDDAIIAEQTPERTMDAIQGKQAETFGVPRDKVFRISVNDSDPLTAHYFRKVTGLCHKSIGTLKVQFAFPGMPMVTFYGDEIRAKSLYPQEPFRKCRKGDIGVTNQSRPHHGLMGIRLEDSKEYGPSGEEPYGTNIIGRFLDDVKLLSELDEEETIYITEGKI